MRKNDLILLSDEYSSKIYKLVTQLRHQKEFALSNQILRSGTSIGANIREAQYAQSKADFVSKLSISLKEAGEAKYWILFFRNNQILESYDYAALEQLNRKITACLIASIKTAKANIMKEKLNKELKQ